MTAAWLHTALAAGDFRQAMQAARQLACLPPGELSPLLGELAKALADPARARRAALVHAVLGPLAAGNLSHLLEAFASRDWTVCEAAAAALASAAGERPEVRRALTERALFGRSRHVRQACLNGLANGDGGAVLDTVRAGLSHVHARVRCRALRVVAVTAPTSCVDDLTAALNDSHFRVRRTAAHLLASAGPSAWTALARLARVRFGREPRVAAAAQHALDRLSGPLPAPLRETVARLTGNPDPQATLRQVAGTDGLPEPVRTNFRAACERRTRWHHETRGQDVPAPLPSLPGQLETALAAARRPHSEAVWLVGWLVSALLDHYHPTSA